MVDVDLAKEVINVSTDKDKMIYCIS